jgi:hypothetical protein
MVPMKACSWCVMKFFAVVTTPICCLLLADVVLSVNPLACKETCAAEVPFSYPKGQQMQLSFANCDGRQPLLIEALW